MFVCFFDICSGSKKKCLVVVIVIAVIVALALALGLVFGLKKKKSSASVSPKPTTTYPPPPTAPPNAEGPYARGAVATDAGQCSEIGRDILKKNGTAVDATVASLFCVGVINMHSTGIGGGGFMVVYSKKSNSAKVINFRETAPSKANSSMFVNNSLASRFGKWHFDYFKSLPFYLYLSEKISFIIENENEETYIS